MYKILTKFTNILFPPKCLSCNKMVMDMGGLCKDCFNKIDFITEPCCHICATPFEFYIGENALCGECIANPPLFNKLYTVFRYNEHSKILIHNFKYLDHSYAAPYYAKWMQRSAAKALEKCDLILAIPLHKIRLLKRMYNQAALLALHLSKLSGKEYNPLILKRVKNTKAQAGLSRNQRLDNVKSAFQLNSRLQQKIINKNILLIDDVLTTGATINACVKLLLDNGSKNVDVATLAKTTIS